MQLTVLGSCGAWPTTGAAGSGFLLQHSGFRLLIDIGYATVPRLQQYVSVGDIDAVFVSHRHPDHCVDLNPLLRARTLRDDPAPPLPVFAPTGSLDALVALDRPGLLDQAYVLSEIGEGSEFDIGPFQVQTRLLPHSTPNAGIRLTADDRSLVYTGDSGPSTATRELAEDADLLLAEASFIDQVPDDSRLTLSSARQRAELATHARVRHLTLTHLLPGTDATATLVSAQQHFGGELTVATGGLELDIGS